MKQVYFETFGCQMNVADTDRMELLLFHSGYIRTPNKEEADLVLINTCSIRDKAEQKVLSLLGNVQALKRNNPDMMIGLTGCMAQQEGERIAKKFPSLDLVLGPDAVEDIAHAVTIAKTQKPLVWTEFASASSYSIPEVEDEFFNGPSAFVNVIKGCDKFCSFCIVPFTRGREKSREADEICLEAAQKTANGAREIILLGQNVNSYGKRGLKKLTPFHQLLRRVAEVPGVERLRFTTSHPKDFTSETVSAYRELDVLMNHLHLPVQCGNDRVLERMRRGHTSDEYLRLIDNLRAAVPDVAISTDIIVGFPGETEAEFQETLKLMQRVEFDNSFMFSYSPRPGTPASELEDNVPEKIKWERLQETIELQKSLTDKRGMYYVGQTVEVMIEDTTRRNKADFRGRTPHYWMAYLKGGKDGLKPGDRVKVLVEQTRGHSLIGVCQN
tara:strand:+ start:5822 stop:7147 length:1326 start_codon:yes stop_codon:yes gene_type:complete